MNIYDKWIYMISWTNHLAYKPNNLMKVIVWHVLWFHCPAWYWPIYGFGSIRWYCLLIPLESNHLDCLFWCLWSIPSRKRVTFSLLHGRGKAAIILTFLTAREFWDKAFHPCWFFSVGYGCRFTKSSFACIQFPITTLSNQILSNKLLTGVVC